jgi:5,10-methylenetetrahydromethanopterin reductase
MSAARPLSPLAPPGSAAIPVGVVLGSALPPERIRPAAHAAAAAGMNAVWLSEDYFFTGGISSAAGVLATTPDIQVGLGIVSALTRHPALLAMELASLARTYPGRLAPAIGLGLPKWLAQMGLTPDSSLDAVRACIGHLRSLLAGETVTSTGGPFTLDRVALAHPCPRTMPPIRMGVSGPRMLRLAGEVADGVVLSVMSSVNYVRWAREQVALGAVRAGRSPDELDTTVYAFASVDEHDSARARAAVRHQLAFYLAGRPDSALTRAVGIVEQLTELAAGGPAAVEANMPERWIDELAIAGTPDQCATQIRRLREAGADAIGLFPCPVDDVEAIVTTIGHRVLPLLHRTPAQIAS